MKKYLKIIFSASFLMQSSAFASGTNIGSILPLSSNMNFSYAMAFCSKSCDAENISNNTNKVIVQSVSEYESSNSFMKINNKNHNKLLSIVSDPKAIREIARACIFLSQSLVNKVKLHHTADFVSLFLGILGTKQSDVDYALAVLIQLFFGKDSDASQGKNFTPLEKILFFSVFKLIINHFHAKTLEEYNSTASTDIEDLYYGVFIHSTVYNVDIINYIDYAFHYKYLKKININTEGKQQIIDELQYALSKNSTLATNMLGAHLEYLANILTAAADNNNDHNVSLGSVRVSISNNSGRDLRENFYNKMSVSLVKSPIAPINTNSSFFIEVAPDSYLVCDFTKDFYNFSDRENLRANSPQTKLNSSSNLMVC